MTAPVSPPRRETSPQRFRGSLRSSPHARPCHHGRLRQPETLACPRSESGFRARGNASGRREEPEHRYANPRESRQWQRCSHARRSEAGQARAWPQARSLDAKDARSIDRDRAPHEPVSCGAFFGPAIQFDDLTVACSRDDRRLRCARCTSRKSVNRSSFGAMRFC